MRNRLMALTATAVLGLLPLVGLAQQEPVQMNNLAVTDLSVSSAYISWTTDQQTVGNKVEITSADSTWQVADNYAAATYAHLVQVTGLEPSKEYSYKVISDQAVWDNNGARYKFSTIGYTPASPLPSSISGYIADSWGNLLNRCLIRFWLYNDFYGISLPRVMASNDRGSWNSGNLGLMINSSANGQVTLIGDDLLIMEYVPNYWTSVTDSLAVQNSYGTITIQVTDPNAYESGDVDGNGAINIFDLLDLLKVMGKKITPDPRMQAASDLDANGRVDVFDLLELLKKMKSAKAVNS